MTGRAIRAAAAAVALAGAVVLMLLPLVRTAEPFDAALRTVVWLATVVAAVSGAGKPAAVFAVVAAAVETAGVFTGPHPLWVCAVALLVAATMVLTRSTPAALRTGRLRTTSALPGKRSGTEVA